jgi:hypothetical protein
MSSSPEKAALISATSCAMRDGGAMVLFRSIRVAAGESAARGATPNVRGTFDGKATYSLLDIVALNGSSFIAQT